MENNIVYKVVGIGTIRIKIYDDIIRTLPYVSNILELKKILIYLGIVRLYWMHIKGWR